MQRGVNNVNKRIKKKQVRYNIVKRAKRQYEKRKGYKCIAYALMPIAPTDKQELQEHVESAPYATHFVIAFDEMACKRPIRNEAEAYQYRLTVHLCDERGRAHDLFSLYVYFINAAELSEAKAIYDKTIEHMRDGVFWKNT